MSFDPRDNEWGSSSEGSCSTGDVIEALYNAEAAQAEAFGRTTGVDAVNVREAMVATRVLREQIQQLQGTEDLTAAFRRDLYAIPAAIPNWLPTVIAKHFGTAQTTRTAIMDTARHNAAVATAGGGAIRSLPELRMTQTTLEHSLESAATGARNLVHRFMPAQKALTDARDTIDSPNRSIASSARSARSAAISDKRLELLRIKEQKAELELELLEKGHSQRSSRALSPIEFASAIDPQDLGDKLRAVAEARSEDSSPGLCTVCGDAFVEHDIFCRSCWNYRHADTAAESSSNNPFAGIPTGPQAGPVEQGVSMPLLPNFVDGGFGRPEQKPNRSRTLDDGQQSLASLFGATT